MAEQKLGDDEFVIEFGDGPLGLDLIEVRFPGLYVCVCVYIYIHIYVYIHMYI